MTVVYSLLTNDSGCGDILISNDVSTLRAQYEYSQDGEDLIGVINFEGVVAYRFRNELHSSGYVKGSYDAIVEIIDSQWLTELQSIAVEGLDIQEDRKHFAIMFSNNGYLEIISKGFSTKPSRKGLLGEL